MVQTGTISEANGPVREGLNILDARIEDNAQNEKNAVTVKFFVDRVKPEVAWEVPPFSTPEPFITNDGAPDFQAYAVDPMPMGPKTSSGLRKDAMRFVFFNSSQGTTLERKFGDNKSGHPPIAFSEVSPTDPFRENVPSDSVPREARVSLTNQPLDDGQYKGTVYGYDRATVVG